MISVAGAHFCHSGRWLAEIERRYCGCSHTLYTRDQYVIIFSANHRVYCDAVLKCWKFHLVDFVTDLYDRKVYRTYNKFSFYSIRINKVYK